MRKTLGGIGAAFVLVALAVPGTATARQQAPSIHKQAAGEEFSSQQRRRVHRRYVRRAPARYSYGYGNSPYYAGYGSAPYPAAYESTRGYRYVASDNQASFSWGGPYYAGYGSSPYPAAWEMSSGYRYSRRPPASYGNPYYAGYGSSPYPAAYETAPRR